MTNSRIKTCLYILIMRHIFELCMYISSIYSKYESHQRNIIISKTISKAQGSIWIDRISRACVNKIQVRAESMKLFNSIDDLVMWTLCFSIAIITDSLIEKNIHQINYSFFHFTLCVIPGIR